MRVLLIDADSDQVDLTAYALRREGFEVTRAADGEQGLDRFTRDHPELVVLDLNLPRLDGFEVCRRIRQLADTPIIILTARDTDGDVVEGLHLGADDYIVKPFSAKRLVARMRAVVRRTRGQNAPEVACSLQLGDLVLDKESFEVSQNGRPIQLTRLEFKLLFMLVLNARRVIPYTRLIEYAWGFEEEADAKLVKTHICHLRTKLGWPASKDSGLQSVPGVGYRLMPLPAATGITRTPPTSIALVDQHDQRSERGDHQASTAA